jgi:hypothetical protein
MRLVVIVAFFSMGTVSAQRGVGLPGGPAAPARGITPLPGAPGGMRPGAHLPGRVVGPGRAGWGWGWGGLWSRGWWDSTDTIVVREQPPEFIAPNAMVNKDYKPEKLNPDMREYPAGSLPEPVLAREIAPLPAGSCRVAFQDGSSETAQSCRLEANLLVYVSARGTIKRVSLDLVDLDRSALR